MTLKVSDGDGKRLDAFLALALPELSRSRIQSLIKEGHILLNCTQVKARASVSLGDSISVMFRKPHHMSQNHRIFHSRFFTKMTN
jgi:23S rRNA pseudouridine1911/1915/1917 synthase